MRGRSFCSSFFRSFRFAASFSSIYLLFSRSLGYSNSYRRALWSFLRFPFLLVLLLLREKEKEILLFSITVAWFQIQIAVIIWTLSRINEDTRTIPTGTRNSNITMTTYLFESSRIEILVLQVEFEEPMDNFEAC